MTLTSLSKSQILAEKSALDSITASHARAFRKSGLTWAGRVASQTAWQNAHRGSNYSARLTLNRSILSDQRNIDRWYLESPEYAAIVATAKAKADLIVRNDLNALQIWTRINNKKIADQQAEIARLAAVKEKQRLADIQAENLRLELIQEKEELERISEINRIQSIRVEKALILKTAKDKETQRITKSIPLLTTILPVGIISLLLLAGRK